MTQHNPTPTIRMLAGELDGDGLLTVDQMDVLLNLYAFANEESSTNFSVNLVDVAEAVVEQLVSYHAGTPQAQGYERRLVYLRGLMERRKELGATFDDRYVIEFDPSGLDPTSTTFTDAVNALIATHNTATDSHSDIRTLVTEETTARQSGDTALGTRVTALENAGGSADTSGLATKTELAAETTARENADTALGTRIDGRAPATHSHDESTVTGLTSSLAAKADSVDLTAHENSTHNTDTKARADAAAADAKAVKNTEDLNAEIAARQSGDTGLSTRVSALESASGSTDLSGLATKAELATETSERESADTALGTRISNLDIPNVPDAPSNASEAKKYELNVPATRGDATWVEAEEGGGGDVTTAQFDAEVAARAAGDKWVSRTAGTAERLHFVLTNTAEMALARLIEITDEVLETHQGVSYDHKANSIGYALPGESSFTFLFDLTNTVLATAASSAQLAALLVTHVKGHSDLIVYIGAAFTHEGTAFKVGDFVTYEPQSITPDVKFNIPPGDVPDGSITLAKLAKDVTDRLNRYYGKLEIVPTNIPTAADIERGIQVALSDVQVDLVSEANELDLWINGKGFHSDDPYTPAAVAVFDASVNATEAASIALTEPAQGEVGIVEVLAVWRKDGEFIADMGTYLTIGGAETGGGGAVRSFEVETYALPAKSSSTIQRGQTATLQWTEAEIKAVHSDFTAPSGHYLLDASLSDHTRFSVADVVWDTANSRLEVEIRNETNNNRAFENITVTLEVLRGATSSGGGEVPDGSITTAKLGFNAVTTEKIALRAVDESRIDHKLQVAALELVLPATRPAMAGAYDISFSDSSVLNSGGFYLISLNGINIGTKTAWTQQTSITVTPTADNIRQMALVSSTSVLVNFAYSTTLDGATISGHTYLVQITPAVDVPEGIPDAPKNTAAAKKYELNVPATSGDATWEEAAGGGGPEGIPDAPAPRDFQRYYALAVGLPLFGPSPPHWQEIYIAPRTQRLASAAAITFNVSSGEVADVTLAHNTTLTLSGGANGGTALLRVKQDTTGSRTLTLASGLAFAAAPTLTTTAGKTDLLMFHRLGNTWKFVGIVKEA